MSRHVRVATVALLLGCRAEPNPVVEPPAMEDAVSPRLVLSVAAERDRVPPGTSVGLLFQVTRQEFEGEIALATEDLPEGFTGDTTVLAANATEGSLTLTVNDDAPVGGPFRVVVRAAGTGQTAEQSVSIIVVEPPGQPDSSFGTSGVATIDPGGEPRGGEIALDGQGRLLVAGSRLPQPRAWVARLLPGGLLDTTFGEDGLVSFPGTNFAGHLLVRPDDGAYVLGDLTVFGESFLDALDVTGQPVATFGDEGRVVGPFTFLTELTQVGDALVVVSRNASEVVGLPAGTVDNNIGLLGFTNQCALADGDGLLFGGFTALPGEFLVARTDIDGISDDTFGQGGFLSVPAPESSTSEIVWRLAPTPEGDTVALVAAGLEGLDLQPLIFRFDASGNLDETFGTDGLLDLTPGVAGNYSGLAVQDDGRILVAGTDDEGGKLWRLLSDGQPDPAFGEGGVVETLPFGGSLAYDPRSGRVTLLVRDDGTTGVDVLRIWL